MSEHRRPIRAADRRVAAVLLVLGAVTLIAAPLLAAPWALESGWLSPRFGLLLTATAGVACLGGSAAAGVLRRLRKAR